MAEEIIDKKFIQTAIFKTKYFDYFGIHETIASLYGAKAEDIVEVEVTIAEDQTIPPAPQDDKNVMTVDYWGWFDSEKQEFTNIRQKHFLLEMCFPYGLKAEEKAGRGKAYRVNVKLNNE